MAADVVAFPLAQHQTAFHGKRTFLRILVYRSSSLKPPLCAVATASQQDLVIISSRTRDLITTLTDNEWQ